MISGIGSGNYGAGYMQSPAMQGGHGPAEMFKQIDTDGSGGISQSELESMAEKFNSDTGQSLDISEAFTNYDKDGDGELSNKEMDMFMKSTMQPGVGPMNMAGGPGNLFDALDSDGSGGISADELSAWAQNMSEETGNEINTSDAITTYDTDNDGELSSAELKSFMDDSGIPSPRTAMGPPPPPPPSEAGDKNSTSISADSVISQYDADGDGVLSSTELQSYLDEQKKSTNSIFAQALSAYTSSLGNSRNSSLQDLFMGLAGGVEKYSPINVTG